jgi:hypothetical protein
MVDRRSWDWRAAGGCPVSYVVQGHVTRRYAGPRYVRLVRTGYASQLLHGGPACRRPARRIRTAAVRAPSSTLSSVVLKRISTASGPIGQRVQCG